MKSEIEDSKKNKKMRQIVEREGWKERKTFDV